MSASLAPVMPLRMAGDVEIGVRGDRLRHADRTGKTDRRPGHLLDDVRGSQFELLGADGPANLAFVRLVVASEQNADRFLVRRIDECLDHLRRLARQHRADGRNTAGVGSGNLVDRLHRHVRRRDGSRGRLGLLDVGRVAALLAIGHFVLAVLGGNHELVAGVAPDGPALRLHRQILQPAPVEDTAVGGVHLVVNAGQILKGCGETVRVLHQELARPARRRIGAVPRCGTSTESDTG